MEDSKTIEELEEENNDLRERVEELEGILSEIDDLSYKIRSLI